MIQVSGVFEALLLHSIFILFLRLLKFLYKVKKIFILVIENIMFSNSWLQIFLLNL